MPATGLLKPARSPRSPDRQASIERRRRQGMSGVVPAKIAASFTMAELAVLTVIARQCQRTGVCVLPIDAIAALAGVSRTVVQNAMRLSKRLGLLSVRERRIPGRKSLTNIVTVTSKSWLAWLRIGSAAIKKDVDIEPIGFRNMSPTGEPVAKLFGTPLITPLKSRQCI